MLLISLLWSALGNLQDAQTLVDQKQWSEAKVTLMDLTEREPQNRAAFELLAQVGHQIDDVASVLPALREGLKCVPSAQYRVELAKLLSKRLNQNKMLWMSGSKEYKELLDEAIKIDPDNVEAYHNKIGFLCNAPAMVGGDKKDALVLAKQLTARIPREGFKAQASVYQSMGEDAKQLAILKTWNAKPTNDSLYAIGRYYISKDQPEVAMTYLDLAEKDYMPALYQSAKARILAEKELEEAVKRLDLFLESPISGLEAGAYWRKGQALAKLGEIDRAREAFERAIEIGPDFKEAKKDLKRLK